MLKLGMKAEIIVDSYPNLSLRGEVASVSDPIPHRIETPRGSTLIVAAKDVIVTLSEMPDDAHPLLPGMTVRVDFEDM